MFYFAVDGNEIGRRLDLLISTATDAEISAFSKKVSAHVLMIASKFESLGGEIIFATGDGILARSMNFIDISCISLELDDFHFSLGIGNSALEASIAMRIAKSRSDSAVVFFPWSRFDAC